MADNPALLWRATLKRRLIFTATLLGLWSACIQARLVFLQVVKHDELMGEARQQQLDRQDLPGRRGEIRDRNGHVLARSVDMPSIKADPSAIDDPAGTVRALCGVLGCSAEQWTTLTMRIGNRDSQYAPVRDHVEPELAKRVEDLKLKGVYSRTESRRYYPDAELAAHVLGYVNSKERGLGGIEGAYDSRIRGRDGKVLIQKVSRKIAIRTIVEKPPTVGESVELTIDAYIQHVAETELIRGVKENSAVAGSVIVQDPSNGGLLALANYPTFDPNRSRKLPDVLRNRAVEDLREPGSVIKMVTASAALEQKVVTPEEMIDVSGGQIVVGGTVVHDSHTTHNALSFTDVIVNSSNVGAIRVGLRLGRDRLTDYLRRFGFGQRLSPVDFPGESYGIVHRPQKITDGDLARISMGYTIGVTPLQLAAAVSSIANGGELMQPRVVRAWIKDGVRTPEPTAVLHRTVAPQIAAEVTAIMEGVVDRGTGTQAQIEDYTIAGKTGTAAKAVEGGYSKEYNATFVGFVPSRKPVYTIVVVIDSPRGANGYYASSVAAPVFRRIAEQLLRHEGVPRSVNAPPPVLVQRAHDAGHEVPASGPAAAPVVRLPRAPDSSLPDVTGLSAREALSRMVRFGVTPRLQGTGVVVGQQPAAGTALASGATVTLFLARESVGRRSADMTTQ